MDNIWLSIQVIVAKTRQKYNSKFKTLHRPSFIFSIMLQTSEKVKDKFSKCIRWSYTFFDVTMTIWRKRNKAYSKISNVLKQSFSSFISKFRPVISKYWLVEAQFFSIPLDGLSKTRLENVPRLSKSEAKSRWARFGILP